VHRGHRCTTVIEQAVEFGQQNYGDGFYLPVKPRPKRVSASGSGNGAEPPATSPQKDNAATFSRVERSDQ
jgi:hypothetical protein